MPTEMAVERESSVQLPGPLLNPAVIFERPGLAQAGRHPLLFRGSFEDGCPDCSGVSQTWQSHLKVTRQRLVLPGGAAGLQASYL